MPASQWSEIYETGDPQIDADHRAFFQGLEALRQAIEHGRPVEHAAELLSILHEHALAHFQREEITMHRVGCPAHAQNCAEHHDFIRKLDGWTQLICFSQLTPSLVVDIHREASHWMTNHILKTDCRLRGCLKPISPKPASEDTAQPAAASVE